MALLALEDGTVFTGEPFGARGTVEGEVVFNTGLTGYVEVLTDPSYRSQIVAMTNPHIGNYGVTYEDLESARPQVAGFIVREASRIYSNWRATSSLEKYLEAHGIVGITEVDTRALTRHIRSAGAMRGALSSEEAYPEELIRCARRAPAISSQELVAQVSCPEPHVWSDLPDLPPSDGAERFNVIALDFGIKRGILRHLETRRCRVTVVPALTPARRILELRPEGIFLSNGPGDPRQVTQALPIIQRLIETNIPLFGICLGHQLLGLACGARAYKLKFGHRGVNQPVQYLASGRVEITTHNHGYALDDLPPELEVTHINLNDGTIEGLQDRERPIFSVQYHPEAAPGPHDSGYLFDRFVALMRRSIAQTHRY